MLSNSYLEHYTQQSSSAHETRTKEKEEKKEKQKKQEREQREEK